MSTIHITKLSVGRYPDGFAIFQPSPTLSWRFGGDAKDWVQDTYDIELTREDGTIEVFHQKSQQSVHVSWPGKPLQSRERVLVRVKATSSSGIETPWASLQVEVALLHPSDWKASVTLGPIQPSDSPKRPFHLRKRFTLPSFKHARVYLTALGMYELLLNGQRVGDHCLAPGWQSYNHRLHYQTFDIGSMLRTGDNELMALVGEGWYAGRLAFGGGRRILWGSDPGLILQLEVDGKVMVMSGAQEGWETAFGQLVSSEIYDGEVIDTRIDMANVEWTPARSAPLPETHLIAPEAPPVRRMMEIEPKDIITTPSGKVIVDFGQNLVGWVRINEDIKGDGNVILSHAEVLEHGELGSRPLRGARATDTVILGGSTRGYEPKFTWHGFRYAQIDGWEGMTLKSITAIVIYSDMERLGEFSCSHSLINKFHESVLWGTRGNFVSVPTDCPQRDERLGWSADLQVFAPTASFLFDTAGMLGDWLQDLAAEQLIDNNGVVPLVVPDVIQHYHPNGPPRFAIWCDVAVITPLDLYSAYDDKRFLTDQYESMAAWLEKGVIRNKEGLWEDSHQLADWLDPRAPDDQPGEALTDPMLVADAYLVHVTRTAARYAKSSGRDDDASKYESDYKRLLAAFQTHYMTPTGRLASDTQTAFSLALVFDLLPSPSTKTTAIDRLAFLIRNNAFKIGTGFAGSPIVLHALAENGQIDIAYRMFQEKECPSLLYPVSMGATTMWERWNSMLPDGSINPGEMTSFNHYALGSTASFLHKYIGGISPLEKGWKKLLIKPVPGGTVTSAEVSHISPYGRVSCKWVLKGEEMLVDVEVPPNSTARVVLPGVEEDIGSGTRSYKVKWEQSKTWPPKVVQRVPHRPRKDIIVE